MCVNHLSLWSLFLKPDNAKITFWKKHYFPITVHCSRDTTTDINMVSSSISHQNKTAIISWAAKLSIIKFPDPSALHIMSRLQRFIIIYRIRANPASKEYFLGQVAKFFLSLSLVKMTSMSPHVPISLNIKLVPHLSLSLSHHGWNSLQSHPENP